MGLLKKKYLLLSLFFCLVAFPASALTLGSVSGGWSNPNGSVLAYTTASSSYGNGSEARVSWGRTSAYSYLGFTGSTPPSATFDIGDAFQIGQLTHYNAPTYTTLNGIDLSIALSFSDPAGLNDTSIFSFTINNTPNTTGNNVLDADFIFFPSSYASQTFSIYGIEYTLQLLGFGSSSSSLVSQFESPENTLNNAILWGRITTPPPANPVPEPTTMVLLGTGLLGLAGFRKKIKK